ncbi:MAG: hypothetical protein PHW73_14270 [Atribacterota bacterium]|nr:hypothetical protein [Atribacterota bacterium]
MILINPGVSPFASSIVIILSQLLVRSKDNKTNKKENKNKVVNLERSGEHGWLLEAFKMFVPWV